MVHKNFMVVPVSAETLPSAFISYFPLYFAVLRMLCQPKTSVFDVLLSFWYIYEQLRQILLIPPLMKFSLQDFHF